MSLPKGCFASGQLAVPTLHICLFQKALQPPQILQPEGQTTLNKQHLMWLRCGAERSRQWQRQPLDPERRPLVLGACASGANCLWSIFDQVFAVFARFSSSKSVCGRIGRRRNETLLPLPMAYRTVQYCTFLNATTAGFRCVCSPIFPTRRDALVRGFSPSRCMHAMG